MLIIITIIMIMIMKMKIFDYKNGINEKHIDECTRVKEICRVLRNQLVLSYLTFQTTLNNIFYVFLFSLNKLTSFVSSKLN